MTASLLGYPRTRCCSLGAVLYGQLHEPQQYVPLLDSKRIEDFVATNASLLSPTCYHTRVFLRSACFYRLVYFFSFAARYLCIHDLCNICHRLMMDTLACYTGLMVL